MRRHQERHSGVDRGRAQALELGNFLIDTLAPILATLVGSSLLDAFFDAEHLPQSGYVQDKHSYKDPKFHQKTSTTARSL